MQWWGDTSKLLISLLVKKFHNSWHLQYESTPLWQDAPYICQRCHSICTLFYIPICIQWVFAQRVMVSRSTFDLAARRKALRPFFFLPIWITDSLSISVRFFCACDVSKICTMCKRKSWIRNKMMHMIPGSIWSVLGSGRTIGLRFHYIVLKPGRWVWCTTGSLNMKVGWRRFGNGC